jgi:hypothetical protein
MDMRSHDGTQSQARVLGLFDPTRTRWLAAEALEASRQPGTAGQTR